MKKILFIMSIIFSCIPAKANNNAQGYVFSNSADFARAVTGISFLEYNIMGEEKISVTKAAAGALAKYNALNDESVNEVDFVQREKKLGANEWLRFTDTLYKLRITKWEDGKYGNCPGYGGGGWRVEITFADRKPFKISGIDGCRDNDPPNWGQVSKIMNEMLNKVKNVDMVDITATSTGHDFTIGLKRNGRVVTAGRRNFDGIANWNDIIAISAGGRHAVGLKRDGTVAAVGSNKSGQCDVSPWRDIAEVFAGNAYTMGLRRDGTVVGVGRVYGADIDLSTWSDIIAVSAGVLHVVGLKRDGTVVTSGNCQHGQGRCDVSDWRDITAVAATTSGTVGLKKDGTVVATGMGKRNPDRWKDIIARSCRSGFCRGFED
ncbi:MAG: hypothetical protein LBB56_01110 [Chitinispirillales bacterium]|jgi:hypothetical protein|nr:hypothetical protein [Chitinispirillales bacterium]